MIQYAEKHQVEIAWLFDLACPDVAKRQGLFEATPTHFILHDMHIHLSLERIANMPDYQRYCITVASVCSLISEYDVIHTFVCCFLGIAVGSWTANKCWYQIPS